MDVTLALILGCVWGFLPTTPTWSEWYKDWENLIPAGGTTTFVISLFLVMLFALPLVDAVMMWGEAFTFTLFPILLGGMLGFFVRRGFSFVITALKK